MQEVTAWLGLYNLQNEALFFAVVLLGDLTSLLMIITSSVLEFET